jgi:hypothetical protein
MYNFLMAYFKDMKNDNFTILVNQTTVSLLESFKVGLNDLHKLNEDQLKQFKESMVKNPGHRFIQKLRDPSFSEGKVNMQIFDLLMNDIIDMLAKKLPTEVGINNQKLDSITQKIRLVQIPKGLIEESFYREDDPETIVKATINIKAVVRIVLPKRMIQEEVDVLDPETQQIVKTLVDKEFEMD